MGFARGTGGGKAEVFLGFSLVLYLALSPPSYAQDQLVPPKIVTVSPTGVNLADGSFSMSNEDLNIGSLTLTRSYSSAPETSNHYFGQGWTHNYDIWVRENYINGDYSVDVVVGRTPYKFWGTISQNYFDGNGPAATLTAVSGVTTFTDPGGTVYRFLSGGYAKVASITYPSGEVINFSYSAGLPKVVASTRGYALVFDYIGSNVSAACGYDLSAVYVSATTTCAGASYRTSYSYTSGKLTSFQDAALVTTGYTYGTYFGLMCATIPGTSTCRISNVYTGNPHGVPVNYNSTDVTQQTLADGSIWSYNCSCGSGLEAAPDDPAPQEYTTVTKPDGSTYSWVFVNLNQPYIKTDELGKQTTYSFSGPLPLNATLPEGNQISWSYSSRGIDAGISFIAKPNSALPTITTGTKTYPTDCANPLTCNEPMTVSDSLGNVTNLTYDPGHGGVLSEMQPAPSSGGPRPLKLYTYVQKYAYVMNAGGSLAAAGAPIWMPDTMTECQTTAGSSSPVCDTSAPVRVTNYEYGAAGAADTLLARGIVVTAGGVSLRTCYGYDARGRKISTTMPRAGLAVCP